MLRIAAVRAARGVAPRLLTPAFFARAQRYESNTPKPFPDKNSDAFKAALELSNDLQRDWDAKVVSYEELLPKTRAPSPETYLIDVREPDEVIQGMIPSAVNIPLSVLANSLNLLPDSFKEKHGFEKPKKSQEVIFYCRSGKRSTSASDVAKRNGYTNILNYTGSWLEWVEKGGEKTK
ncbi:endoplasmic reticulum protein [Mycena metata]|uniref:Endoplasmic reticulum protein n=1 Tax=Mycena metata TaxID=1033252 RepID=A0AAD7KHW4_9AGAR|nr:endoplasmic reticulum protein [Mycena metata]